MNNIGKIVGIYLYIGGTLGIILMFINIQLTGNINIPLSFFYYVCGYYLINHNNLARKIVIVACGLIMLLQFSVFLYLTFQGLPEGADIRLGGAAGIIITDIISKQYFPILFLMAIIFPAIPFFLLRTKKAKQEFEGEVSDAGSVESKNNKI